MSAGGRAGRTVAAIDGVAMNFRIPTCTSMIRREETRTQEKKWQSLQQVHAAVYDCERGRFNSILLIAYTDGVIFEKALGIGAK